MIVNIAISITAGLPAFSFADLFASLPTAAASPDRFDWIVGAAVVSAEVAVKLSLVPFEELLWIEENEEAALLPKSIAPGEPLGEPFVGLSVLVVLSVLVSRGFSGDGFAGDG